MHLLCKKSTECATGDVCDRQKHECRASLRKTGPNKAAFAKVCLTKGIPIAYERGDNKGQRKSKNAMRQCQYQNDRNGVKPHGKVYGLPAPARPPTKNMKKDQLQRIYKKGQNNGYINPDKTISDLTNKQLANAILRATKKQY